MPSIQSPPRPKRARRPLTFLAGFLKHPREVGSVIPSSRDLIRRIVRQSAIENAKVVVELGPGTGVVTREMLKRMRPDARLIAMEINPLYIKSLERDIRDPRFSVYRGPAVEIGEAVASVGAREASLAVSGIPFSTMGTRTGIDTLERVKKVLEPGGRFVAYQFRSEVRRLANPIFGPGKTYQGFWNIPPMRIYVWNKRASDAAGA